MPLARAWYERGRAPHRRPRAAHRRPRARVRRLRRVGREAATTAAAPPPATTTTAVDLADGKAIFSSSCAGCHTLAAAGASGTVGPSLDKGDHSVALHPRPRHEREHGQLGVMPAFVGSLTAQQIQDVAAFVSRSAGQVAARPHPGRLVQPPMADEAPAGV